MANTYVQIATNTVGAGGASAITFSSIPQTYTDLCIKISGRSNTAGLYGELIFNGSTTSYTTRRLEGDGSTVYSSTRTDDLVEMLAASTYTASTFSSLEIYIPNYTSSNNKSFTIDFVTENNATSAIMALWAGLWSNTAAITSISLDPQTTAQFVQYSTATLYGIKKN